MVLGGVWGCTVSWLMLGDRVFPELFTRLHGERAVERYIQRTHIRPPFPSSRALHSL